eukprot:TRINITY_DN7287_c0_g1_i5.p1 TRINITY_DN7287_c0_g1~~TRINITY_DN7287_c0_g1_i5.p1  ORF type:complete len:395 (+),score=85.82 TRINITY_DN7287_c0_g1_i5:52-1236(+)
MSSDEGDEDRMESKVRVLRSLVTGPEAGGIIGRKGESIKNIREESKAKVQIDGDSQQERLITVEGKTDSIFKAYTMICKILESRDSDRDSGGRSRNRSGSSGSDINLKLLIPTVQAGAIIGKGGENIKEMRNKSGATINFNADPLPGSSERELEIRGKREEVTKCIYSVVLVLMENPAKDGDVRLYQPERDRDRNRDRMMRGSERMGGGGRIWSSSASSNFSSSGGRDRRSRRDETPPPRWGGGGGPMGNSPAFNILMDFARSHSRGRRGGGGGSSRESKHEMYINNDQVGSVIGMRGSKIQEIRDLSGASINIKEVSSRASDPDRERVIEIVGNQEQVALAKSLINVAIELGDSDHDRGDSRRHQGGGGGSSRVSDRDRSRSRDRYSGGPRRW